ncbi:MAG: PIN domain-containing protein [Ideonella sp.]|nr:PIN domain-containing protein [Ideonella sp.]
MVYLDTSVVLAQLFAEDRVPPAGFWSQGFVASRLLEFEVFNRVHACGAMATHAESPRQLVDRVNLLEMSEPVLGRALQPFARPLRTLDALHLATMDFLRRQGLVLALASYDQRLAAAAAELGFATADC